MATWAVGDVHGCFYTLMRLLQRIDYQPARDRLWLLGDLVNRGAHSAAVLTWAADNAPAVQAVLGNHDIALLLTARGLGGARAGRQLAQLAAQPSLAGPLAWLGQRPLMAEVEGHLLVHAGLVPAWTAAEALALADTAAAALSGPDSEAMWRQVALAWTRGEGAPPRRGDAEILSWAVRAMTTVRAVDGRGHVLWHHTAAPQEAVAGAIPWFAAPGRRSRDVPVAFGHWSRLGLVRRDNVVCLDSGCAWGRQLTAWRPSDGTVVQQACDARDIAPAMGPMPARPQRPPGTEG